MKNNPFNLVKSFFPARKKSIENGLRGYIDEGGQIARPYSYRFYKDNQYENGYSSIRAIANEFMTISPYAIDATGKRVESNVINKIFHPNRDMSSVDFREALAIMTMIHRKTYILVWHYDGGELVQGGPVTVDNLAGFTFLEGVSEDNSGDQRKYRVDNKVYTTDDVMELKGINPYNLSDGFSPSQAARKWTRLDDYIADYELGFFENGAVPAGQFVIKAKTGRDFNDIVSNMQAKHRGAGANNNVSYVHEPLKEDGQGAGAQITWVPFNTDNSKLDLKNIFENVNRKIDSIYGVPASIRGDNTANTYASVRVDEVIMAKYAVKPIATKIWTKFTHEMNRLTGGMGIAITFDFEIPNIAEEEKINSERKKVDSDLIISMTRAGYTLDAIIAAFGLPEDYMKLGTAIKPPVEDNPDIDTGDEVDDSPIQDETDEQRLKAKQLSPVERESYEERLARVVRNRMISQINTVLENLDNITKAVTANEPIELEEDEKLKDEMLAVLTSIIFAQGMQDQLENVSLVLEAGISTEPVSQFHVTPEQRRRYDDYVKRVAVGYNDQTAERIREIITNGRVNALTTQEIKEQLSGILAEEWRIKRIAVSEVNRAGNESSLMSMQNIARETGAIVVKEWVHGGGDDPCEFCRAMIGTQVPVDDAFIKLDGVVRGEDGGMYINSFTAAQVAELHPNGHCRQVYRVMRG